MDRFLQRSASWIIKSGLKMAGIHLRKRKNCPNIGVHFYDLIFSTRSKMFNRVTAKEVVQKVYGILSRAGFRPQYRKTKIIPPGSKKIVLGLNVDGAVPRLQKEFKDRLRQHLYYLEKLGPIEHANRREFDSVWGMKCHIKGLIDYANMIEPEYSMLCLEKFEKFEWPV